jgi:hypothetical protein
VREFAHPLVTGGQAADIYAGSNQDFHQLAVRAGLIECLGPIRRSFGGFVSLRASNSTQATTASSMLSWWTSDTPADWLGPKGASHAGRNHLPEATLRDAFIFVVQDRWKRSQ